MTVPSAAEGHSQDSLPLAIVLAGVSDEWQKNVLQIRGLLASASVTIDGCGAIVATALVLAPDQARHLATQIIEILGPEHSGLG
jgi:hypothetical protein